VTIFAATRSGSPCPVNVIVSCRIAAIDANDRL
jgi:hypothetical protein